MRVLRAIGRALFRAVAFIGAIGKPAEQMNGDLVFPPTATRSRPEDYRP